ncbi:TPA: glycosyltransferase family 2 protein [Streptococcus pneumoniae]|uniref:Glycosyl transferase n=2 Tax=Streptococcus pneumoniae TaxID=1313 RepID=O86893_STREE|nr:glycosyltransferase [Streptococcus pneumoniae]APA19444.1 WciF [Streptococcus pneumoniae]APA19460.1 WciF [Streptococcus pneumoniae]APA19476.1 WciF [Streptococcus pneumoniae]APA19492.1 WciF [Streptococcus pneumoniae]AQW79393.1 WciF [Streptococcus pneumoniae]
MISVIVPVYNVADYLRFALDSLLEQTYKDFEVILVNDGSTDNSGEICDEYGKLYDNIHVFHKKNGGLSDARNFGLEKSRGEFITFLDSDDYFEPYALELLITIQKKYDVDIVSTKGGITYSHDIYSKKLMAEDYLTVKILTNKEFLAAVYYNDEMTVSAWGKLYKRDLFKTIFPKGKIYEDLYVVAERLLNIKTVAHTDLPIYHYYQRQGSIVNSTFSDRQYDFFDAIDHNEAIIKKFYCGDKELLAALNAKRVIGSFILSNSAFYNSKNDITKIIRIIKPYYWEVIKNKKIPMKRKVQCVLFLLSPNYYYKIKDKMLQRGRI